MSNDIRDVTALEAQQQFVPEEAVALTSQKDQLALSSQVTLEHNFVSQVRRSIVVLVCVVLLKIVQVLSTAAVTEEELVVQVAGNGAVLVVLGTYLATISLKRAWRRHSKQAIAVILAVYIVFLVLTDSHHIHLLLSSSPDFERVSNDVFVLLTLCLMFGIQTIENKKDLLAYLILAGFATVFGLFVAESWELLSSKPIFILAVILNYHGTPGRVDAFSQRYSCYSERRERGRENIEEALKACDVIADSIKQASRSPVKSKYNLKLALSEVRRVKQQIAHGPEIDYIPLEEMDEEERAFCIDHYTNFSGASRRASPSPTNKVRRQTLFQLIRQVAPFQEGGGANADAVLHGLGRIWNFDVMLLQEATGLCVKPVAEYLFASWVLNSDIYVEPETVSCYFSVLEAQYRQNPYHNAAHAVDVLNSVLYFVTRSSIAKTLSMLETVSVFIAALAHDVAHPAVNNKYLVATKHPLALKYNDLSVLENMHASLTFELMQEPGCDLFEHLNDDDAFSARKLIINMILSTDMSKHFENYNRLAAKLSTGGVSIDKPDDREFLLCIGLKCGDVGHAAKSLQLHKRWTEKICEEFFRQGDLERSSGLPVSAGCDRFATNVSKSQAGFLKYVCLPLFEAWANCLDSTEVDENCVQQLKDNILHWESSDLQRTKTLTRFAASKVKKQKTMRF